MPRSAVVTKKRWHIRPADERAAALAGALRIHPLVAQVLINRGLCDADPARAFLDPKLIELIEPDRMTGMDAAVARLREAMDRREPITLYGDYDVDGITGVAILYNLLTLLGAEVRYYIPHRIDEGYGVNAEALDQIAADGTRLVVTIDCGITAVEQTTHAAELGMDVIVTDHHRPGPALPAAAAIVHPGLDAAYPNPDSAGATVAFKLAWALVNAMNNGARARGEVRRFLLDATTLAAIGTIADVVDLRGENRVLAHYGLQALRNTEMTGLRALIDSAELNAETLDGYDIGFRLAPMLNAAGRMGHARLAVELLTSDSEIRCMQIARYLRDQNRQRQACQRQIVKQARERIAELGLSHPDRRTLVLADMDWHGGVLGIVAARLAEEFLRPTVMISAPDGQPVAQGSARSVAGFNLYQAICACGEHLVSFGGHAMAAGVRISSDRIEPFTEAFEAYAQEHLDADLLEPSLHVDAVCRVGDLSASVVGQLHRLEPFGQGHPAPVFVTRGVRWISPPRVVGVRGDHLQIAVSDGSGSAACIGFGMGRLEKKLLEAEAFSIAYKPQFNTFRGAKTVQFVLDDVQFD